MGHRHQGRAWRAAMAQHGAWAHVDGHDHEALAKNGPPPGYGPPGGFGKHHGGPVHGFGFGPPPGFGPPWMRGRGPGRGGRPRGDVRTAILVLLAEQPRHGYDLIKAIEERSSGSWSPSAGSIYPTLQSLEDEGLITIALIDGRKTASLTAAGREWVEARPAEAEALFATPEGHEDAANVMQEFRLFAEAVRHASHRPELAESATAIIASARKQIYQLLAEAEA
jgi:DNA-binding PadR family transcriptional regulator